MTNKKLKRAILLAAEAFKRLLEEKVAKGETAREMASYFGISRNALQEGFQELYGMGVRDFKLKQRMERSKQLLESGKDVKQTARLLHYKHPRAFSTAFKKYYGTTPTRWASSVPL